MVIEGLLNDQTTNSTSIEFWPFFLLTVEKCLVPRTTLVTCKAIQALYDEIVNEVIMLLHKLFRAYYY